MRVPVDVDAELVAHLDDSTVRQLSDAAAGAVASLLDGDWEGRVRPWDVAGLRRGLSDLGEVTHARVVHAGDDVLIVELRPASRHLALRRVDHGWRLARFVGPGETTLPPETTRRVPLHGSDPDAALAVLGIVRPPDVELVYDSADLGQGETEYRHGYRWTEGTRTIVAEEVKTEIFDGATPYSTYLRVVVVDGPRGAIVSGSGDSALLIEG